VLKVLEEDTMVDVVGVGDMVVVDGEAGVVGWAWGAGMAMDVAMDVALDVAMDLGDLIGQIVGILDFMAHARTDVRAPVTELGDVSIQAWDAMIVYSPMTVSGVEVEAEADGGR
jgi:hypothetical protein